jgi:hypothetical protein
MEPSEKKSWKKWELFKVFSVFFVIPSFVLLYFLVFQLVLFALPHASDGGMISAGDPLTTNASKLDLAKDYLKRLQNKGDGYLFTQPCLFKYDKAQWTWDSTGTIIANARIDLNASIAEFATLLKGQEPSGRIPQILFWPEGKAKDDLVQIPTVPFAFEAIFQNTKDRAFLAKYFPPMLKYYNWWWNERRNSDGLVTIIHPWESGLDASPAYDPVWGFTPINDVLDFLPLYLRFYFVNWSYKYGWNYNATLILKREKGLYGAALPNWFNVQDVAVNTVYAAGWRILATLAKEIDDPSQSLCAERADLMEAAIKEHMWSEELQRFVTRYTDADGSKKISSVHSIQTMFPLLLQNLTKSQETSLLKDISDESKFWTKYPFPTVSKAERSYTPVYRVNLMWRGPGWAITNWFIIKGLSNRNPVLAKEAVQRWSKYQGHWEQWNPETGVGYGAQGLGMSALIIDSMYQFNVTDA